MPVIGRASSSLPFGNCRVFCDPRAVDIVLDEDAAASAAAAGAEWRKEAIISEIGALGGFINRPIIYHDGANNWGVSFNVFSGGRTVAIGLPVVAVSTDYTQQIDALVTFDYASSQINAQGLGYSSTATRIIDSLPDGSRHLIGLYGTRSDNGIPKRVGRSRLFNEELYALVELTLSGQGPAISADYRLLYSPADAVAAISRTNTNTIRNLRFSVSNISWVPAPVGSPTSSVSNFSLEDLTGQAAHIFKDGVQQVSTVCEGALISAYYGSDGSIKEVRKSFSSSLTVTASSTLSVSDTPATGVWSGRGVDVTGGGSHSCTLTETINEISDFEMSINDGGVISRVSGRGRTSRTRRAIRSVEITTAGIGQWQSEDATDTSCSQSLDQDGRVLHDFADAETFDYLSNLLPGTSFQPERGSIADGLPGPFELLTGFNPIAHDVRVDVCPVSYNPSLIALSTRMWLVDDESELTLRIGDAICRGVLIPGWREGALPAGMIFGSVNPVTGQYVRDADRTVSWL